MNENANISEQLSAYLDGELDEARTRLVEEALANDAELARELAELRATRELLKVSMPTLKAPADFADKVTRAAGQSVTRSKARWTPARQSIAAAAIVLCAVGAGLIISHQMNKHMQPPETKKEIFALAPQVLENVDAEDLGEGEFIASLDEKQDEIIGEENLRSLADASEPRSMKKLGADETVKSRAKLRKTFGVDAPTPPALAKPVEVKVMAMAPSKPVEEAPVIARPAPMLLAEKGTRNETRKFAKEGLASMASPKEEYESEMTEVSMIQEAETPLPGMAKVKQETATSQLTGKKDGAEIIDADVAELADLSRAENNEVIWTDNLPASQKTVERILVSNGFELAPEKQDQLISNQAINLNNSFSYNRARQRTRRSQARQVEYLVVGKPKQIDRLKSALRNDLQQSQTVSQLPEPLYQQALQDNTKTPDKLIGPSSRQTPPRIASDFAFKPKTNVSSQPVRSMTAGRKNEDALQQIKQETFLITLNFRSGENLNRDQVDALRRVEMQNKNLPIPASQPAQNHR